MPLATKKTSSNRDKIPANLPKVVRTRINIPANVDHAADELAKALGIGKPEVLTHFVRLGVTPATIALKGEPIME